MTPDPVPNPQRSPQASPETAGPIAAPSALGWLSLPAMRYPSLYVWFLFFSSLDIMLTWAILLRNGTEVNPLAAVVIDLWGLPGAIAFKFSLMLFVVIICEVVGRSRDLLAQRLMVIAVTVSAMPVIYSLGLLVLHTMESVR